MTRINKPLPIMTRYDRSRIQSCVEANALTWEDAERLCKDAFGTKIIHLLSYKIKLLLVLIDTKGEARVEAAKRKLEAERDRIRSIRKDWSQRSNKVKLAAKRRRRAKKVRRALSIPEEAT